MLKLAPLDRWSVFGKESIPPSDDTQVKLDRGTFALAEMSHGGGPRNGRVEEHETALQRLCKDCFAVNRLSCSYIRVSHLTELWRGLFKDPVAGDGKGGHDITSNSESSRVV